MAKYGDMADQSSFIKFQVTDNFTDMEIISFSIFMREKWPVWMIFY